MKPNPALNLAPFSRWALRDKAAQRRLALRYQKYEIQNQFTEEKVRYSLGYFMIICLQLPSTAFCLTDREQKHEETLTEIAKSRCDTEQIEGKDYEIKVLANGNVEISFIGKKGGGVNGTFQYTSKEWEGRQKVLKEHQATENSDRRKCIRDELKLLRENYHPSANAYINTDESIAKEYDDHRDGIYIKLRGHDSKSALVEMFNNNKDIIYISLTNYMTFDSSRASFQLSSGTLTGRWPLFNDPAELCPKGNLGELVTSINPNQKKKFYIRPKNGEEIIFDDYSVVNIPLCYKIGDREKGFSWNLQLPSIN